MCINGCSFSGWINPSGTSESEALIARADNSNDMFFSLYIDHLDRYFFSLGSDGITLCNSYADGVVYDEWYFLTGVYNDVTDVKNKMPLKGGEELELTIEDTTDDKNIIKKVLDKSLSQVEASRLIGLSDRQVRRLVKKVRLEGDIGIIHRSRGKPSNRSFSEELRNKIIDLYKSKYFGLF